MNAFFDSHAAIVAALCGFVSGLSFGSILTLNIQDWSTRKERNEAKLRDGTKRVMASAEKTRGSFL